MALPARRRRQIQRYLAFIAVSAVVGAGYGFGITMILTGRDVDAAMIGVLRGLVTAPLVAALIAGFEIFYASEPIGEPLRRLPFAWLLLVKTIIFTVFIIGSDMAGAALVVVPGATPVAFNRTTLTTLGFALAFSFIVHFVMQIGQLLGPGVLPNFIRGRYHEPRHENRLFLFIDMRGSTAIAEKIGDIAFHRLLDRFFYDVGNAVADSGGQVHKYVGDELIATWPMDGEGRHHPSGAIAAAALARANIQTQGAKYQADFGVVPDFRAVLHAGPVVVGELGYLKREIALLGDTINTTAKLEQLVKRLPHDTVASAEALAAVGQPVGWRVAPIGEHALPGKSAASELFALSPVTA